MDSEPTKTNKNILIVEDHIGTAETFKELLELLGHKADYRNDCSSTAALLEQEKFDVIFMDINLGGVSGTDWVRDMKSSQPEIFLNTRLVAVSGHSATDMQAIKAMEQFDCYLEKPVDLVQLDKILASF
jgi:DNA-binding NtrC family response regulator